MSAPTARSDPLSCPICEKPESDKFEPFCSKRCADVDLNRWLSGSYAIPGRDGEARREDAPVSGLEDDA